MHSAGRSEPAYQTEQKNSEQHILVSQIRFYPSDVKLNQGDPGHAPILYFSITSDKNKQLAQAGCLCGIDNKGYTCRDLRLPLDDQLCSILRVVVLTEPKGQDSSYQITGNASIPMDYRCTQEQLERLGITTGTSNDCLTRSTTDSPLKQLNQLKTLEACVPLCTDQEGLMFQWDSPLSQIGFVKFTLTCSGKLQTLSPEAERAKWDECVSDCRLIKTAHAEVDTWYRQMFRKGIEGRLLYPSMYTQYVPCACQVPLDCYTTYQLCPENCTVDATVLVNIIRMVCDLLCTTLEKFMTKCEADHHWGVTQVVTLGVLVVANCADYQVDYSIHGDLVERFTNLFTVVNALLCAGVNIGKMRADCEDSSHFGCKLVIALKTASSAPGFAELPEIYRTLLTLVERIFTDYAPYPATCSIRHSGGVDQFETHTCGFLIHRDTIRQMMGQIVDKFVPLPLIMECTCLLSSQHDGMMCGRNTELAARITDDLANIYAKSIRATAMPPFQFKPGEFYYSLNYLVHEGRGYMTRNADGKYGISIVDLLQLGASNCSLEVVPRATGTLEACMRYLSMYHPCSPIIATAKLLRYTDSGSALDSDTLYNDDAKPSAWGMIKGGDVGLCDTMPLNRVTACSSKSLPVKSVPTGISLHNYHIASGITLCLYRKSQSVECAKLGSPLHNYTEDHF